MERNALKELLDELLPSLEALEGRTGAILEFMRDKGLATDEELAPYLEQANNAANVRWLAARLRINRILATVEESATETAPAAKVESEQPPQESQPTEKQVERSNQPTIENAADDKPEQDNEDSTESRPEESTSAQSPEKVASQPEQKEAA